MPTNIDRIRIVGIEYVIQESPTVRTLVFKDKLSAEAKPGQFLMVWIPRAEELPMSVMVSNLKGHGAVAAVTVRKHGYGSTAMFEKKIGELLGIRGPYGNEFELQKSKKVLLVGGGTGLVPLMRLAIKLNKAKTDTTVIIGSTTRGEVFFERLADQLLSRTKHLIIVTTEDGSYGMKGYPTDAMEMLIARNGREIKAEGIGDRSAADNIRERERNKIRKFDVVYTCGPELMMRKVFDLATSVALPVQASLERYMKCGIGICSSCCLADQLVCRDGTVYNERQLSSMKEFGTMYRDKSGRRVAY